MCREAPPANPIEHESPSDDECISPDSKCGEYAGLDAHLLTSFYLGYVARFYGHSNYKGDFY